MRNAQIVWIRREPRLGYGIMFKGTDKSEATKIRHLIKQLKAASEKTVVVQSKKGDSLSI